MGFGLAVAEGLTSPFVGFSEQGRLSIPFSHLRPRHGTGSDHPGRKYRRGLFRNVRCSCPMLPLLRDSMNLELTSETTAAVFSQYRARSTRDDIGTEAYMSERQDEPDDDVVPIWL
jgi:hypothetical protein